MNPEEREAYLKSLYGEALQDNYNKSVQSDTQKWSEGFSDFDYWKDQYDHDKHTRNTLAKTEYDWEAAREAERLGTVYEPGSPYNTENLWKKQGYMEQLGNASNRFLWNTIGDTVGGFTSMIDLPGYIDPNKGVFRDFAETMRLQKEAVNKANPIYQKEGAGMTGPGMAAWWIENGSSLASSASSFMLQGAGIGKAMQGVKWLSSINKIGKVDDIARRGKDLGTNEILTGVGKTGDEIAAGLERGDKLRNLTSSVALTQSAAMMSATETYANVYQEALDSGYGEEYAKSIAGSAASNVVNLSRANILLNMTSTNKFLGGSKNIKSLKPESFLPSWKNKTLGTAIKEGGQEAIEENIELSAQKQAESLASDALSKGVESETIKGGAIPGVGLLTAPLLTGNVYGDTTWKELTETTLLGAIGGIGQTGLTDLKNRIGSETSFGGLTKGFGTQLPMKNKSNDYYSDGSIKSYAGDNVYETEDNIIKNDKGEDVLDYIYEPDGSIAEVDGKPEVRQKVKTDESGQPIIKYETKKYSQKEIDEKLYEDQVGRFKKYRDAASNNVSTIATAKYQAQLDKTIGDLNDYVDLGKTGFDADKKAQLVDDLARINLVNKGTIDLDANPQLLIDEKATVAKDLDNMSAKQIRQKQDELLNFSLSRTAIESFENGTKEPLIEMLKEMRDVSPEKAKELGYDENYKQKAQEAIDQVNKDFDRWMEFNTKRPGNIARALFKNRKQHDFLSQQVDTLNKEAQDEHDKAVKQHAAQNDIDLNKIDEKDGNFVSVKSKYDEAFKIEQDKIKKIDADKQLKDLEKEFERLQNEQDVLKYTGEERHKEDPVKYPLDPIKYHKALKAKSDEIDDNLKAQEDRRKEIGATFDDKIKELVGSYKSDKAAEIYQSKLKAVQEARNLDKIFDELVSKEGEQKLAKIARQKAIEVAKVKHFNASIAKLIEFQKDGGKVYYGEADLDGVIEEVNGKVVFTVDPIQPFYTLETSKVENENGEVMSAKDYYESVVDPRKENDWKEQQKKNRADSKVEVANGKDKIKTLDKELKAAQDSLAKISSTHVDLGLNVESPTHQSEIDNLDIDNEADRETISKRIARLNKIAKLLNPDPNFFPSYLVKADIADGERKLFRELDARMDELEKNIKTIEFDIKKTNKSIDKSTDKGLNKKVPSEYRLYKVENKDGLITITQRFPGTISIPLNFDNLLKKVFSMEKLGAEIRQAHKDYTQVYIKKMETLKGIHKGTVKAFNDSTKEKNRAIEDYNKFIEEYESMSILFDAFNADKTGRTTVDFTDKIANKFNKIVAGFKTGVVKTISNEKNQVEKDLEKFKKFVVESADDIKSIDEEIINVQQDILKTTDKLNNPNFSKLTKDKSQKRLNILNNNLSKLQNRKKQLEDNIPVYTAEVSKHENYVKVLENHTDDLDLVQQELNDLIISRDSLAADIAKMNNAIENLNSQLSHVTERIAYNQKLQVDIIRAISSRKSFNNSNIDVANRYLNLTISNDDIQSLIYDNLIELGINSESDINEINELIFSSGNVDFNKVRRFINRFGLDNSSDIYTLFNQLNDVRNELEILVDTLPELNINELESQLNVLQSTIKTDLETQELLEQLLGNANQRQAESIAKAEALNTINADTIHILETLNRNLQTFDSNHKVKIQKYINFTKKKVSDAIDNIDKLHKDIVEKNSLINKLDQDLATIHKYNDILNNHFGEFLDVSKTADRSSDLSDMLNYVRNTPENGKLNLLNSIEAQLGVLDNQVKSNQLEIEQLGNLIKLRAELAAIMESGDISVSPDSLNQRMAIINDLHKSLLGTSSYLHADKELQELFDNLLTQSQTREAGSINERRRKIANELPILRQIFKMSAAEEEAAARKAAKEAELAVTVQRTDVEEGLTVDMNDGNPDITPGKLDDTQEKWQASKDSIFTSIPRHIDFNKDTKERKYIIADKEGKGILGLPVMTNNEDDKAHMEFLNSFSTNPDELFKNYKLQLVQVSGDNHDTEMAGLNIPQINPANGLRTGELKASEADKLSAKPGVYAIITTNKGERVYINSKGESTLDSSKPGFKLAYSMIPNPDATEWFTKIGENMMAAQLEKILNKVEGYTKLAEFGIESRRTVVIGGSIYSVTDDHLDGTLPIESLKELLTNQIKADMRHFRSGVTETINSGKTVFVPVTRLSAGSLLDKVDSNGEPAWTSADRLFGEDFDQIHKTERSKQGNSTKDINGLSYNLTPGLVYAGQKDGSVIPVYPINNDTNDVELILQLIAQVSPKVGEWNSQISLPIQGTNLEQKVNLVSNKNKEIDQIGLLNKLINWTGNRKDLKGNDATQPFDISISGGYIKFKTKDNNTFNFPVEYIAQYLSLANRDVNQLKEVSPKGSLKYAQDGLPELIKFLESKRKHIHYQLISSTRNKKTGELTGNLMKEYLHPVLVNGRIELRKYKSYKDYLGSITKTNTLSKEELGKIGVNSNMVGKYFTFGSTIEGSKEELSAESIKIGRIHIDEGMLLTDNKGVEGVVGKDLMFNGLKLDSNNIKDFTFTKLKPKKEVKPDTVNEPVNNKPAKVDIKEETKPVPVSDTKTQALKDGDKIVFSTNVNESKVGDNVFKGVDSVEIISFKYEDNLYTMFRLFTYEGESYYDFYKFDKDGQRHLITDSFAKSLTDNKSDDDKVNISIMKALGFVNVGNKINRVTSAKGYQSRNELLLSNNGQQLISALDYATSSKLYYEQDSVDESESEGLRKASKTFANTISIYEDVMNKYLPYVMNNDTKSVEGLNIKSTIQDGKIIMDIMPAGSSEFDSYPVTFEFQMETPITNLSQVVKGNNAYSKLIKTLAEKDDNIPSNLLDIGITYTPHLNRSGAYFPKANRMELSLGSIIQSSRDKDDKTKMALIAHEFIHALDKNSDVKQGVAWGKMMEIREAILAHLDSNVLSKQIEVDGKPYSSVAYWLFGQLVETSKFNNAINTLKLAKEGLSIKSLADHLDIPNSTTEFFSNVLDRTELQEFLNSIPFTNLGLKWNLSNKVETIWDAFKQLLGELLESFGLSGQIVKDSVLEGILKAGAAHYKQNGKFTDLSGLFDDGSVDVKEEVVKYEPPIQEVIDTKSDVDFEDSDSFITPNTINVDTSELTKLSDSLIEKIKSSSSVSKSILRQVVLGMDNVNKLREWNELPFDVLEEVLLSDEYQSSPASIISNDNIDPDEVDKAIKEGDFNKALSLVLTGTEYAELLNNMVNDPDFIATVNGASANDINRLRNEYIRNLYETIDIDEGYHVEPLVKLSNYVNNSVISNRESMLDKTKELSSSKDFKGESLSQVEFDSAMSGMTSYIFDYFANEDADLFLQGGFSKDDISRIYNTVRDKMIKTSKVINRIIDNYRNPSNGENIFEKYSDAEGVEKVVMDIIRRHSSFDKLVKLAKDEKDIDGFNQAKANRDIETERLLNINKFYSKFLGDDEASLDRFKELTRHHSMILKSSGFKFSGDIIDELKFDNEMESSKDPVSAIETGLIDQKSVMPGSTKLMVASLASQIRNNQLSESTGREIYEVKRSYLGFLEPNDFNDTYNLLVKTLANLPGDRGIMMEALMAAFQAENQTNPNGVVLKGLVESKSPLSKINKDGKTNLDITFNQFRLINQFVQTFSKFQPNAIITRIDGNGVIHHINANIDRGSELVRKKWMDDFKHTLVDVGNDSIGLNLEIAAGIKGRIEQAQGVYNSQKNIKFGMDNDGYKKLKETLASIGMYIEDVSKADNHIRTIDIDSNIFQKLLANNSLADALLANSTGEFRNVDYNPFTDRNIEGTIKTIAEAVAYSSNQVADNQYMWNNQTQYSLQLNSNLSTTANMINYYAEKGMLRTEMPHLFNVYNQNSVLRKLIEEEHVRLVVGELKGLTGYEEGEIDQKELDAPNKWASTISATMHGFYGFFRAADRGKENCFSLQKPNGVPIKMYDTTNDALNAQYGYLLDEINSMVAFKKGLGKNVKFYNKTGNQFRFFSDDKISNETKEMILADIEANQPYQVIKDKLENHKSVIIGEITSYFRREAKRTKEEIRENGLLVRRPIDKLTQVDYSSGKAVTTLNPDAKYLYYVGIGLPANIMDKYVPSTFNPTYDEFKSTDSKVIDKLNKQYEESIEDMLFDFTLYQYGMYVEQTKMITGDPAMYKNNDDFFKRMSMLNSTKKISIIDKASHDIMNHHNRLFLKMPDTTVDGKNVEGELIKYTLTPDDTKAIIKNNYQILGLSTESTKAIKAALDSAKIKITHLTELTVKPDWGFNPDYIKTDGKYDGYFKSMIGEDIPAMSVLAVDRVTEIKLENGKLTYYNGDEKLDSTDNKFNRDTNTEPAVSKLRKMFAEEFLADLLKSGVNIKHVNMSKLNDKVTSYLSPYLKMDESDAQAWVTLPMYKEILMSSDSWTAKHEKAYAKMIIGQKVTPEELSYFRVLKTQYAGPMGIEESSNGKIEQGGTINENQEQDNLYIPVGYKHSLFPLTPDVIADLNLGQLNKVMSDNGVGIYHTTSANKFGRMLNEKDETNRPYNNKGEFQLTGKVLTQTTSLRYFGIQLDQAPKMKAKITAGTQWRKLALSNLIEFGVPVDFKSKIGSIERDDLINEWNNMSESERKANSPLYSIYLEYQNVQRELFSEPFRKLVKELGVKYITRGGKIVGYQINKRQKLVDILMQSESDLSDNAKASIQELLNEDSYIEQVSNRDKAEAVMFAIVNSRVLKEKRKGEGSPQVAVTFFEGKGTMRRASKPDKKGNVKYYSSDELRHYDKGHNGQTLPAHCMVGLPVELAKWVDQQFKGLDGFNLYLNALHAKLDAIEIEGKNVELTKEENDIARIITLIGFRIPNQGLQSAEYMRVRKFLPSNVGDSIVVPTEMVGKAGSDFDIDKLNVYFAHYSKTKVKGQKLHIAPTYIEYDGSKGLSENNKEALQNRMIELQAELMSNPYNYRQLMSPISDVITKAQAWGVRMLNTQEGIDRLQSNRVVYENGQWVSTGEAGLQQIRHDKLKELLGINKNKIVESITFVDDKGVMRFVEGSKLDIDAEGNVKYDLKDVDLQQVNLTPDGQMQWLLMLAPIYSEYQSRWIDDRDEEMKNKSIADVARPIVNINKFIEFLSGKAGVGQTAVHITHHQLAMAANLGYNTQNPYWIFDHTKVKGVPSFANKLDKDGEWISETLSAFVNAYVDIAKDPYVKDMNAGNRTANMMLMMVRAGASVPWITKFICQPIVKDYIQAQRSNESMFNKIAGIEKKKYEVVADVMAKYGKVVVKDTPLIYSNMEAVDDVVKKLFDENYIISNNEMYKASIKALIPGKYKEGEDKNINVWNEIEKLKDNHMFTEEKLSEYILFDAGRKLDIKLPKSKFLTDNPNVFNNIQTHILDLFLEYQRQSKDFQMMIRVTSADTKQAQQNMEANKDFFKDVELVKFKNRFTNLDKIWNESVVSEAHNILGQTIEMLTPLYYFEKNKEVLSTLDRVATLVKGSMSMNGDELTKMKKIVGQDFTTALVTSDLIDDTYSPRTVFNELFIEHPSNTYVDSTGMKCPLSKIIYELNNVNLNINKIEAQWKKEGNSDPNTRPSILDLRSLKKTPNGGGNPLIQALVGTKVNSPFKSYDEFTKKKSIIKGKPRFNNVIIKNRINPAMDNVYRNAFIKIKESAPKLYNDLIRLSINQSGIHQTTNITFSKLIPAEDMNRITSAKFAAFDNLTTDNQVNLLQQFERQFMQRSLNYINKVSSTKKGDKGYYVKGDDGRAKIPALQHTKKDEKTGDYVTTLVIGKEVVGKTTTVYFSDNESTQFYDKHVVKSKDSDLMEIRGHGKYFLGYDLSIDDKFVDRNVRRNYEINDNQGEINMMMNEVKSNAPYYTGDIKPEKDVVFVFGSNPEGRHGAGAAEKAKDKFGAIYGKGEGMQGNSYALPTKDLRVKENNGYKSISPTQITENIKKLFQVAQVNPTKQFKIVYRNTTRKSLNGYTGLEMIDMFNNAGTIPSNIIFSKEWFDTGKLNLSNDVNALKGNTQSNKPSVDELRGDKPKQFNSLDKTLKKGSVVNYTDGKGVNKNYIVWNINSSNKVQLVDENGVNFSGTPDVSKIKDVDILGSYPVVTFNGSDYIVTDNDNIYSTSKGGLAYTATDNGTKMQKQRILDLVKGNVTNLIDIVSTNKPIKSSFSYKGTTIETGFELGAQQQEALKAMIDYIDEPKSGGFYTLEGYAGTGKTTIIGLLQKYLESKKSKYQPLYFAQLHAATAQLALSTSIYGNKLLPSTIASSIMERDNQVKFSKKIKDRIIKTPLLIVDEASSIDAEDIKKFLQANSEYGGKMILMGDPLQLPKVVNTDDGELNENSLESTKLIQVSDSFLTNNKSVLTDVHRQKSGPLLDLLTHTRNSKEYEPVRVEDHESVKFQNSGDFNHDLSQDIENDLVNTSIVSFANKSVQAWNDKIRKLLGRGQAPEVGDVLMGYGGYNNKQIDRLDMANSVKYVIEKITKDKSVIRLTSRSPILTELVNRGVVVDPVIVTEYYQLSNTDSLKFGLSSEEMETNNRIVSNIFKKVYEAYLEVERYKFSGAAYAAYLDEVYQLTLPLANMDLGNDYVYDPKVDKMVPFKKYDSYHKQLAGKMKLKFDKGVDYGYAMTIHKSQGLTIGNVYYDFASVDNIKKDKKMMMGDNFITTFKNSLHYVAMSRASKKLRVDIGNTKLPLLETGSNDTDNNTDLSTVDKSWTWSKLENKPVYSNDGVNTMRTKAVSDYKHFGNPFTGSGIKGLIGTGNNDGSKEAVEQASKRYLRWLVGGTDKTVNPEQRKWILNEIKQGNLKGKKLLYMNKYIDGKPYYSHADVLSEISPSAAEDHLNGIPFSLKSSSLSPSSNQEAKTRAGQDLDKAKDDACNK